MIPKRYLLSILILICFFPLQSNASVIIQNTSNINSVHFTRYKGSDVTQLLGTGLSGTIGSVSFMASGSGDLARMADIFLYCWDDNTYTTPCTTPSYSVRTTNVNSPLATYDTASREFIINTNNIGNTTPLFGYTLDNTKYYSLLLHGYSNWNGDAYIYGGSGSLPQALMLPNDDDNPTAFTNLAFIIDTASTSASSLTNTATRIDTVTPSNNSIVATSSSGTIANTGYLSSLDNSNDVYVQMDVTSASFAQAGASPSSATLSYKWNLSSSGNFSFSSTTAMSTIGKYYVVTSIKRPKWFFFSDTLYSTSTSFLVSTSTGIEKFTEYFTNTTPLDECAINFSGTFNLGGCIASIISGALFPRASDWNNLYNETKTGILHKFPIGYITRIQDILVGNATSSLPLISVTIKSGSPLAGNYHFDPSTYIASADNIVRNTFKSDIGVVDTGGSPQNVWDIIMPYLTILGWIMLVLRITYEVIGYRGSTPTPKQGFQVSKDEYAYKTWLYNHKK